MRGTICRASGPGLTPQLDHTGAAPGCVEILQQVARNARVDHSLKESDTVKGGMLFNRRKPLDRKKAKVITLRNAVEEKQRWQ